MKTQEIHNNNNNNETGNVYMNVTMRRVRIRTVAVEKQ